MRIFETILKELRSFPDGEVSEIVLGWHGSIVLFRDGRYGLGSVPTRRNLETFESYSSQTQRLLNASAHELVELMVSPYPQEFAIASAAASALAPIKTKGRPLSRFLKDLKPKKLYLIGYEQPLVLLFNNLNLKPFVLDDFSRKPRVLPSWVGPHLLNDADWLWITFQALRDRQLFSLEKLIKSTENVVLLGPGVPWLPDLLSWLGIKFVAQPRISHSKANHLLKYIAAGGSCWDCEFLSWEVYPI